MPPEYFTVGHNAMTTIHVELGDLIKFAVDAIVNPANSALVLGGGLSGAIRTHGGPLIQRECDAHGPIAVGQAAITTAANLPARYIIHQASMPLGGQTTEAALRDSTRAALRLAEKHCLQSVAFPATGTGIGGFPVRRCAEIMLSEAKRHVEQGSKIEDIYFVLFDETMCNTFHDVYHELFAGR